MAHHRSFDACHQEILQQLQAAGKLEEVSNNFAKLNSDESRAAVTLQLQAVNNCVKLSTGGVGKSNADALKFKDLGNKHFQKASYDEAIKLYTKSILHAPTDPGSGTLAIGYANRSAALYHRGFYELSLLDIERALANNYPTEMCYKVFDRKGKCLKQLGKCKAGGESFKKALACLESSNLGEKKLETLKKDLQRQLDECQDATESIIVENLKLDDTKQASHQDLPSFAEPAHDVFTSLCSTCDVSYTEQQGRFIVAKRDIKPGEIVVIEKPFASVVLLEHTLTHCHHCFKRVPAPVPSQHSCLAMFCSNECKREAETYHQYEWPSLEIISKSGVGKFGYLALRTVAKCGPDFLRKFHQERKEGSHEAESKKLQGVSPRGKYEASNFNTIFSLVTHAEDRSVKDLFRRSVMAIFLLKCLEIGSFFDPVDDDTKFREFVAGLLLSHLQAFPCNAHEISELGLNKRDIANSTTVEIGAGIYSTLSLFNHSCDPVANRNFYGDTCVVRTIRSVKKGEEISDNYGAVYAVQSWQERNNILQPQYYFQCACQPCVKKWPLYSEINHEVPVWKCRKCESALPSLTGIVSCKKCNSQENVDAKIVTLQNSQKNFQTAFGDLLKGEIEKALPALLLHLQNMDDLLCRPWQDYNNCQEAVKQCYSILGNHFDKS